MKDTDTAEKSEKKQHTVQVAPPYLGDTDTPITMIKENHDFVSLSRGDQHIPVNGSDLFNKLLDLGYGRMDPLSPTKHVTGSTIDDGPENTKEAPSPN